MGWINLFLLISFLSAAEMTKFLTKHSPDTLRYISMDGSVAYVQKTAGVLGLVNGFRYSDFLTESSATDFLVKGSPDGIKVAIEAVPYPHTGFNLYKNHKIFVVNLGQSQAKEIGLGKNSRLHLKDEWITFFDAYNKILIVKNISTDRKYEITLSPKANPFFLPEVVMFSQENVTYTDINENGYAILTSYNLASKTSTVVYRSSQIGTKLELCKSQDYLAFGEFPYEGLKRGSKIMHIKLGPQTNLAGYSSIYNTVDQDLGNMVCHPEAIYFVKTTNQDKKLNTKTTDAVRLDLKTQQIETKTSVGNITQLVEMDKRILVPSRGELFVIEGIENVSTDTLKQNAKDLEELPLDI
jgi:hypothetical protein